MARRNGTAKNGELTPERHSEILLDAIETGAIGRLRSGQLDEVEKDAFGVLIAQAARRGSSFITVATGLEELLRFYQTALWVFDCVRAIAQNLAQVPLVAYSITGGVRKDEPESPLQSLIDKPGGTDHRMSMATLLQRWVSYWKLAGTGFLVANRGNRRPIDPVGQITSLRDLRPSRVGINPGAGGVESYTYSVSGVDTLLIAPENMAVLLDFNPLNDFWGLSTLAVISMALATDEALTQYEHDFLSSGGSPSMIAEIEGTLTQPIKNRMRRDWDRRFGDGKTGGLAVFDNNAKLKAAGVPPKDTQFLEIGKATMHRVLSAYGVPPLFVMDLSDASVLANADVQKQVFRDFTLMPAGRFLEDELTTLIQTDTRFAAMGVRFAWEKADGLMGEREIKKRDAARADYVAGAITLNEYREIIGLEPIDGGDELRRQTPPPGSQQEPADDEEEEDQEDDAEENEQEQLAAAMLRVSGSRRLIRSAFKQLSRNWIGAFERRYASLFSEQSERTLARLHSIGTLPKAWTEANLHTVKQTDSILAQLIEKLFPLAEEIAHHRELLEPLVLEAVLDAATDRAGRIWPDRVPEINESLREVKRVVENFSVNSVRHITEGSRERIREILTGAFQRGDGVDKIAAALREQFADWSRARSQRIARTEVTTSLNGGAMAAAQLAEQQGARILKTWITAGGGDVRPTHAAAEAASLAQPIPLGQAFSNGLQYPGDPSSGPEESANCRCSLAEVLMREPVAV